MQHNTPATSQHVEQQPALPTYAEAIRTAPPSVLDYSQKSVDQHSYQPSAPIYSTAASPSAHTFPEHYPDQSNYVQMPHPTTVGGYPPTYGNASSYPPYGQTAGEPSLTTVHIIRPVPVEPRSCCNGTRGLMFGVILGLVILGAILRATMSSYF